MEGLVLQAFTESNAAEILDFVAESFSLDSPFADFKVRTKQDHASYFKRIFRPYLIASQKFNKQNGTDIKFNLIYKLNGKIIGAQTTIQFNQFKVLMHKNQLPEALEPMRAIDSFQQRPGTALVGNGFCVHKDYRKRGVAEKLQLQSAKYYYSMGFDFLYGIIFNPITLRLARKLGILQISQGIYEQSNTQLPYVVVRYDIKKIRNNLILKPKL